MLRITAYARLAGIVFLVVATAGLALFGWDDASSYYLAGVELFFLLIGFSRLGTTAVRQRVGGLGVLMVAVMGVAILVSWLSPTRYLHGLIEIACLILGATSILAARYLPDRRGPRLGRVD